MFSWRSKQSEQVVARDLLNPAPEYPKEQFDETIKDLDWEMVERFGRRVHRKSSFSLEDGAQVEVKKYLSSGGTKSVYDVLACGKAYALGIPNIIHEPDSYYWWDVHTEIYKTQQMHALGFQTNVFGMYNAVVAKDVLLPVIFMKKWSDFPFAIFDGRSNAKNQFPLFTKETLITDQDIVKVLDPVCKIAAQLIHKRVNIWCDNYNWTFDHVTKQAGLFFSDLHNFSILPKKFTDEEMIDWHFSQIIGSFMNALGHETYYYNPYFNDNRWANRSLRKNPVIKKAFYDKTRLYLTQLKNQ